LDGWVRERVREAEAGRKGVGSLFWRKKSTFWRIRKKRKKIVLTCEWWTKVWWSLSLEMAKPIWTLNEKKNSLKMF
jgi:hypothetical protein